MNMRRVFLYIILFCCGNIVCAQSNVSSVVYLKEILPINISPKMDFRIMRDVIPANLRIVPGTLQFMDFDSNNVIDANERCLVRFQIINEGRGDGYGCVARTSMTGNTRGISITDVNLPMIPSGDTYWVEIPIFANSDTQTGEVALSIVVDEPNGFGTKYIESTIGTRKMRTPFVNVVSYKILGGNSGLLERKKNFNLQVIVQNTDQGMAENVQIELNMPKGVSRLGGSQERTTISRLEAGESQVLEYELIANQEAAEKIDVQIALKEKQGKYAKSATIPLEFGQHIGGSIAMKVERLDQEVEIKLASLVSEVDKNIPISRTQNDNTFVLIIANEHYKSVASVPFALNDGNIFREYCIKTLGIPEMNIHYAPNATGNDIKRELNWLNEVANTFEHEQLILYYTGHGIPDENSRTSYLLPIDGFSTDVTTGYKLDHIYQILGQMPADKILVFLDACFSGHARSVNKDDELAFGTRGVRVSAKTGLPQGNTVVFSAAQGDETAYPNSEEQHGLFTYFLLKKLQESKGEVTLHELGEYIKKNVHRQSILINSESQTPCVTPSPILDNSWQDWMLK